MNEKAASGKVKVALAFQGGVLPAGALGAGVMRRLCEEGVFGPGGTHEVVAFSGTSSGALVASVSWAHALTGTMKELPSALEQLWLHVAYGSLPCSQLVDTVFLLDRIAETSPLYDNIKQSFGVPWSRRMFEAWVKKFLPLDSVRAVLRAAPEHAWPHLVLGSAEVLHGDVVYFHLGPEDRPRSKHVTYVTTPELSIAPVLASGSYADVNGFTEIGPGTYCDGAWGTNPPITPLIDCGAREIWLVEAFPKMRERVPRAYAQREDRKEELWQNSLVEHELHMIDKINEWLPPISGNGSSNAAVKDTEPSQPTGNGAYYANPALQGKAFIKIRRMPMHKDLPVGAKFVNTPSFIEEMIEYGRAGAGIFLGDLPAR